MAPEKSNKPKGATRQPAKAKAVRETLPVIPLQRAVIFPYTISSLSIEDPALVEQVDRIAKGSRMAAFMPLRQPEIPKDGCLGKADFHPVGAAGRIVKILRLPDDSRRLLIRGVRRLQIVRVFGRHPGLKALVETLSTPEDDSLETEALARNIFTLVQNVLGMSPNLPEELNIALYNIDDYGRLADFIGDTLNLPYEDKLKVLETVELHPRLEAILHFLSREAMVLSIGSEIQEKVNTVLHKSQREHVLREQLRAIQQQLDEPEDSPETQVLRERIEQADLSVPAREAAHRELERLRQMHPFAPEYNVARNYIEWLISLPWTQYSRDRLELTAAARRLDRDHYDLTRAKERILEFLAVMQLRRDLGRAPILCLVGPPGVGKTSLGQSIANALNRQFVRISLGGVRDEAEIRGHRRTYVGSMPGRIIQGLRRAKTANPVFMLDEIDKLGHDFRGDPAAALLEILDPAQNASFSDHYLEIDFDLSQVLFITTANLIDPIPSALRDRMETIRIPGYTHEEKTEIAKRFLIPRQIRENGLQPRQLRFRKPAIGAVIKRYTQEAGVRDLERRFAKLCRKHARQLVESRLDPETTTTIRTEEQLLAYLGAPRVFDEQIMRTPQVGMVTGLAWTEAGGEVLRIEASSARGKGNLTLTGSLGEVMKESAHIALSYVRSRAAGLKIEEEKIEKSDLHVHVPAGATPKDGPSAGVAMAVALASLLTGRPVRPLIAMSGEISLRGQVMPVGGIKEKVLAAIRVGIKTILLPEGMQAQVAEEVEPELRQKAEIKFISDADQAFAELLL